MNLFSTHAAVKELLDTTAYVGGICRTIMDDINRGDKRTAFMDVCKLRSWMEMMNVDAEEVYQCAREKDSYER